MSPAAQKWASTAERTGRAFVVAFVSVYAMSGLSVRAFSDASLLQKAADAGLAAAGSLILSLIGGNVGNSSTPSLLPARLDPATGVHTITDLQPAPVVVSLGPIDSQPPSNPVDRHLGLSGPGGHWPVGPALETPTLDEMQQQERTMTNPAGDHPQYKLGRVVNHDPRSRDFPHPEAEAGTAFHAVRWARRVGVFDQGQVGSCFPPGTHVRMADGSERAIEDVRLGELVVTAEGGTGRVVRTLLRDEDGGLLRLGLWGHAHLRMTREHPVLTSRGFVPAAELRIGDSVALPKYSFGESTHIATADHVTKASHRLVRGNRWQGLPGRAALQAGAHELPEKIELNERFGRLIGLFLAEGNCDSAKAVWSLHIAEKETLGAEIVSILADYGVTATTREIPIHKGFKVTAYGTAWTRLLSSLCGDGAGLKRLHPALAGGPREFLAAVFSGWRDGDGHQRTRSAEHVGITISRELAIGMYDIAQALGYRPVIRHVAPVQNKYAASRQWRWEIGTATDTSKNYSIQDATHVWRKVRAIHLEDYVGPVYDLTVEGAHSYVAEGIGVHNCTGNAAAGWVGTDDHTRGGLTATTSGPVDEALAVRIYAAAEQIDGDGDVTVKQTGPETFTVDPDLGSSGLSVAKVLKTNGLCSGYTHAFSIQAAYTALQTGPVLAGTNWYQSMFTPGPDGQIHVDKSSGLAGGHEYVLDELEVDGNGQPTKIWMQNSWGEGWGLGGRAYFTPAGLTSLLAANGDVTVPTAIVVAPTPPQPDPTPAPDGDASFLAAFDAAYPGTVAWAAARAAHRSKATGTPMTAGQYLRWLVAGEAGTRPHAGAGG